MMEVREVQYGFRIRISGIVLVNLSVTRKNRERNLEKPLRGDMSKRKDGY